MSTVHDREHDSGAPLAGRSVVVTRASAQAGSLSAPLERLGAEVVAVPVIEIVDPPQPERFEAAMRDLASYDWLIVTSANGADRTLAAAERAGMTLSGEGAPKIAVVGEATARRLEAAGVEPALVPESYRQEGVAAAFAALSEEPGGRVLFARALEGRDLLADELRALGYEVDLVAAYATVPATAESATLERLARGVDVVTFTSPSTVHNFFAFLEANGADAADLMSRAEAASIGPVTTRALLARGIEPGIEPVTSTVPALVDAIVAFYSA